MGKSRNMSPGGFARQRMFHHNNPSRLEKYIPQEILYRERNYMGVPKSEEFPDCISEDVIPPQIGKKGTKLMQLSPIKECCPFDAEESSHLNFDMFVDEIEDKRASRREKALLEFAEKFEGEVCHWFLSNWCITIFHKCLKTFDRGLGYETNLACRIIGLLTITMGVDECNSIHMMRHLIPKFSLAWNTNSDRLRMSVLDALALTTFFGPCGVHYVNQVEDSMKIIFDTFRPSSYSEEVNDWWLRIAIAETAGVLLETGRLDKFTREGDVNIEDIKSKIKKQVDEIKGSKKRYLKYNIKRLEEILKFLETGEHKETLVIPERPEPVEISTFSQSVQLKFFKCFLGHNGFLTHMKDNKVLHEVFEYAEPEPKVYKEKYVMNTNCTAEEVITEIL